ncbi:hypothetical protein, partial [Pseudomonas aeruginosa]
PPPPPPLTPAPERPGSGVRELQEALGARRSWLAGVLAR